MKKVAFLFVAVLWSAAVFAQSTPAENKSAQHNENRVMQTTEKSGTRVPAQASPATLKKIYSNLGKKTDAYNCCQAWNVSGPNAGGSYEFVAIPFTPATDSTVTQVRIAAAHTAGDNQVNLSIYSDTNNAPGTPLAGPITVTNLPDFGTCCTLTIAEFSSGVAVAAGTQYWVVADTPASGTGSDFSGTWNFIPTTFPQSTNFDGQGWFTHNGVQVAAGAVYGTIP